MEESHEVRLLRQYYHEGEVAKDLLRARGFGVTGTGLLDTVKEVIQHLDDQIHEGREE